MRSYIDSNITNFHELHTTFFIDDKCQFFYNSSEKLEQ
jgi:hypothetical protein